MPHSCRLPRLALATALTTGLISSAAQAAEWAAEPNVTLRETYDDNFRLTSAAHDNVWGTIVDPRLKLSRRSELWNIDASGRVRAERYTGEDGLNTVDNFFDIATKRRLERGSLDAKASLINDTTLQNETLDIDTGLTTVQIDRMQQNLRLAGEYMFTEATSIEASADYTTYDYDEGQRYGLLDYDYLTPGLRVIHQYSPQTQVFGVLNHSKVEYDLPRPLESESETDSLQLGASHDITETWKVSGSVGSRRTNTSQVTVQTIVIPIFGPISRLVSSENESTGLVYEASLTREFETGSLGFNASQSVTPSSTGTDTESTRFDLTGTHRFSAKLSATLAVSYYQTSTLGVSTTTANNDRYRIAPSLSWRLQEDLALNTGYTYTRIERGTASTNTVDSNAVFISLGYTWPRMSVSR